MCHEMVLAGVIDTDQANAHSELRRPLRQAPPCISTEPGH